MTSTGGGTSWWDEVDTASGVVELRVRSVADGARVVIESGGAAIDVVLPASACRALGEALVRAGGALGGDAAPSGTGDVDGAVGGAAGGAAVQPAEVEVLGGDVPGPAVEVRPWTLPAPGHDEARDALDRVLDHLRRLAAVLPDTAEVDALGDPTFRVATRMFAVVETLDGVPVLRFKVDRAHQAELLADDRFRPDPDTGHHGWTNLRADLVRDDVELDRLIIASYRLVAPADAIIRLDDALGLAGGSGGPLDGP